MSDFTSRRNRMVDAQIEARGVRDRDVLNAMRAVPRELFVESGFEEFAYEDSPLPIGEGGAEGAEGSKSLRQIAEALNRRGITAPRGGRWHAGQINAVLARATRAD